MCASNEWAHLAQERSLVPLYDYRCESCGEPFEVFVRGPGEAAGITCPTCRSERVVKRVSLIASPRRASGSSQSAAEGCSTGT
jgi:putative FmdB family regulatory protein